MSKGLNSRLQDETVQHVRMLQRRHLHVEAERRPVAGVGPVEVSEEELQNKGGVGIIESWQTTAKVGARNSLVIFQIQNRCLPDARKGAVNARFDIAVLKSQRNHVTLTYRRTFDRILCDFYF